MTCKDCVHYEVCVCHEQEMSAMLLKGGYRDISNDMTDGCRFFKTTWDTEMNYCPNCGADMKKEGAENG